MKEISKLGEIEVVEIREVLEVINDGELYCKEMRRRRGEEEIEFFENVKLMRRGKLEVSELVELFN